MPTVVKGVTEAKRVLRRVDPELYKEMNSRITRSMAVIRNEARSMVPDTVFGLRNFQDTGFERQSRSTRKRAFPAFNGALVRRGLTYSLGKKKASKTGFSALYSMLNSNAAGAIVETAGRLHSNGDPASQSNNPQAGAHFINALNTGIGTLKESGKGQTSKGRLMAAALAGKRDALASDILKAIDQTIGTLQREVNRI